MRYRTTRLLKHTMSHKAHYRRRLWLQTFANFLILTSLFFMIKTFYAPVRSELIFAMNKLQNKQFVLDEPTKLQPINQQKGMLGGLFDRSVKTEVIRPLDYNFGIVIPKIGANSRIEPNVDAGNEPEYLDVLEHSVAHVDGTAFPGEKSHIYLFAHSTDYFWNVGNYNATFYLLYKLEAGDEVNLFYKGQKYKYKIIGSTIVDPSQVQYVTRKTQSEFLTLQTCWPPGTTLQRLLVFAERVAE